MRKIAIILYGPPGSGKGTQANLLVDMLDNIVHFDTGKFIESTVHDPKQQKIATVRRERKLFDDGKLCTPSWVLRIVQRQIRELSEAGLGVVFSGSPRTMYEAEGLIPVIEKEYGKKNIFVLNLDVLAEHSLTRNSKRLVCKICRRPLLTAYYPSSNPKHCPVCGGPLYRRTLDTLSTIKVRLGEYRNRTMPIFKYWKSHGYKVNKIDGRPAPFKVLEQIRKVVK
ncbi:MAG: nucleoside monophosphate kinase [Patescibacteria group bacterium]